MKSKNAFPKGLLSVVSLMAVLLFLNGCGPVSNASTAFWVRGNCEMCKATIEGALTATHGVADATYNLEDHMVEVDYDSTQTNVPQLNAAVAAAGYETKSQPAAEEAYGHLPKCCKKIADQ